LKKHTSVTIATAPSRRVDLVSHCGYNVTGLLVTRMSLLHI